ncbi:UNVERIFIED_CONTAM: hypothetical protein RKD50_009661 [Streptomyces canus]
MPTASEPVPAVVTGARVKTREMAPAGYHHALAAHQAARPDQHVDPAIAEAIESQTRALRELSRRAFPDPDSGDQPTPVEISHAQRRHAGRVTHALALRRARAERAQRDGTTADVPRPSAPPRTA